MTLLARETGAAAGTGSRKGALAKGLRFAAALSFGAAGFLLLAGAGIALGGSALFEGVTFTSRAGMTIRAAVGGLLVLLGLMQLGMVPNPMGGLGALARPLARSRIGARRASPTLGFAVFGFGYLLAGFG